MKKQIAKFLIALVTFYAIFIPATSHGATTKATPAAKPISKTTTKATSKSTISTKTVTTKKTTATKKSSGLKLSNFGYTGRKDPSDMDITPVVKQLAGSVLDDSGTVFKLVDVASAKEVLNLIIADLNEASFKCEIVEPTVNPLITLFGSTKNDTLAACKSGDPADTGFIVYVITDKETVAKYNSTEYIKQYLTFQSPIKGNGKQIQFTPSKRAILFVVGGMFAFDASEISWAVLYNSRFEPPQR